MLEDLAIQYVSQTEENLKFTSFGLVIAGAVVSGLFSKRKGELRRAPYFACSGMLTLLIAVSQFVWLGFPSALVGGYLWVFMAVDVIGSLVGGYFYGTIAMARSRDAYGHNGMAALGFIPIANLWLLLTPSKIGVVGNPIPTIPLLTGGLGVLSGFATLVGGIALSVFLEGKMAKITEDMENDPAKLEASVDFLIRVQGIEAALKETAAATPTPLKVDEVTTILRVEGDGTTLRFTYELSPEVTSLAISMRMGLIQQNCTIDAIRPLLKAGARIEHVYFAPDGSEIGTVIVTSEICGF